MGGAMLGGANNSFACDLYHQLAQENSGDNVFFSPYSLFSVLAMCAEGARGATAEELGSVLRLPEELRRGGRDGENTPWNLEPLHEGISVLNSLMRTDDDRETIADEVKESRMKLWHLSKRAEEAKQTGHQKEILAIAEETREEEGRFKTIKARSDPNVIRAANSLWGEQTCPFRKEYVEVIERHYQTGGLSPADFKRDATGAEHMINDWVEKHTAGRIRNLIPYGSLSALTSLVLANAIYFKGTWAAPFSEEETRPLPFTSPGGTVREVPTMIETRKGHASYAAFNSDGSFFQTPWEIPIESALDPKDVVAKNPVGGPEYPEADGFAMLEIRYEGRRLSMVLIAPNHHDGLAALERDLSGEFLSTLVEHLRGRDVHVQVPRFRFDSGSQLAGTFGAMGLKTALTNPLHNNGADFRGMTSSDEPDDQLYITEIFHKAFVDVNEKGTEAAAASGMEMCLGSAEKRLIFPFIPIFKADSPFISIIRDRTTGTILFMGRVAEPG
jgi:serine protease inhibitor